jgi:hypothetical protein
LINSGATIPLAALWASQKQAAIIEFNGGHGLALSSTGPAL